MKEEFLANKPNNQSLAEHLFAVGFLAYKLFEKATEDKYPQLKQAIFLSGILHDIGKVQKQFQDYIQNNKIDKLAIYEDNQYIGIDNYDSKSKNYFDENIRHNELSLLIFNFFEDHFNNNISYYNKSAIKHIIYYHHANIYRKEDIKKISDLYNFLKKDETEILEQIIKDAKKVLEQVNNLIKSYPECKYDIPLDLSINIKIESFQDKIENQSINLPEFKLYKSCSNFEDLRKSIKKNAENNLLRSCLISADRKISALDGKELSKLIKEKKLETILESEQQDTKLLDHLAEFAKNEQFNPIDKITEKQNAIAKKLANIDGYNNIAVLQGPAGCGKTRIALEWARIKQAKKIIWICPRVQICQGIFEQLTKDYLPDANIEIFTGEFKYINKWDNETPEKQYFNGNIVVTTIDQVLNFIRSHTKVDELLDFMSSHIVFDEFHEFINLDIFNILFAELIANKNMGPHKNTLLVSATPNYVYLEEVLDIEKYYIEEMQSFNKSRYKIEFKEFADYSNKDQSDIKDTIQEQSTEDQEKSIPKVIESAFIDNGKLLYPNKTTFIISNNIIKAQLGFLYNYQNENSILFHSKFKKSDKQTIFNKVYDSFKQNGTNEFQTLRSGPIIQASLNISCDYMVSEISTAENILQRLGRLDRFGENEEINQFDIWYTKPIESGGSKGKSANYLKNQNILQSTKAWYEYLNSNFSDINNFELNQIYKIYEDFYQDKEKIKIIKDDLEKIINVSIDQINKRILDPVRIKPKPQDSKDKNIKISSNSLRGQNDRFIQLSICDVTDYKDIKYLDKYAYDIENNGEKIDNLTDSFSEIFYPQDNNKKYLYNFMRDIFLKFFNNGKKENNFVLNQYDISKVEKYYIDTYYTSLFNYARDPKCPIYLSYIKNDLDKIQQQRKSEFIYYAVVKDKECKEIPIGTISVTEITEFFNQLNMDNEVNIGNE